MIPKKIFYMWCGSTKPANVEMCLLSWHQNLPDYEIIEINETKSKYFDFTNEFKQNDFFRFAYENKMWAYVADYVRFYVLEKFGGIWLDTDVTVLQNFNTMLNNNIFFGRENKNNLHVETAIIGAIPHHPLIKNIVNFYKQEIWESELYTSPRIATYCIEKYNSTIAPKVSDVNIYAPEYFYPYPLQPFHGSFCKEMLTSKSICIHWWNNSWGRSDILEWLKNKHKLGKTKALKQKLNPFFKLYLFGFLRVGQYGLQTKTIQLLGMPIIKIKQRSNKSKALLFGLIPLMKWK